MDKNTRHGTIDRDALARWVLAAFDKPARRAWLEEVEQEDGKALADDLRSRMVRIYRARKQQGEGK